MAKKMPAQAVERAAAKGAGKAPPSPRKTPARPLRAKPVPELPVLGVRDAALVYGRALVHAARLNEADLAEPAGGRAEEAPAQAPAPKPPSAAGPQLVTPPERPIDRAERLHGMGRRGGAVPGVIARAAPLAGPVLVPEGVKFTRCPAGEDMRFRVDPSQPCEGAGFMAEWRKRRGNR